MNKNPLVSIITPTYNMGNYLEETILSVLSQDYERIEYIVIDDGSSDNTSEILDKFRGKIRIEKQLNVGQAKTLNRGWKISKGDFIGYLSADDLLRPNAVSSLINKIKNTDYLVVYPDFELIDAAGKHIRNIRVEEFCKDRLIVDLICQPGPGTLFRREIFEVLGGWNERLNHVADFEFWLRVSRLGEFLRNPEILASFRIHEGSGSLMQVSSNKSNEIMVVVENFWGIHFSNKRSRAFANAKVISARSHAQSGRYGEALKIWASAIIDSPGCAIRPSALRSIISGFSRRLIYKNKSIKT